MDKKWYAVYTKPRWEKKVAESLSRKKIQNYCPLNKVLRQWHDRKKIVMEPLFTSYVFVCVIEKQLWELKKVEGIINVLHWLGQPAVIKDNEIEAIQNFLNEYEQIQVEKTVVRVNDTVKVIQGPLTSMAGNVVGVSKNTIKILLPSLGFAMLAQVKRSDIQKVSTPPEFDSLPKSHTVYSL